MTEMLPIHTNCGSCTECDGNKFITHYHCRKGGTYNSPGQQSKFGAMLAANTPKKFYVTPDAVSVPSSVPEESEVEKILPGKYHIDTKIMTGFVAEGIDCRDLPGGSRYDADRKVDSSIIPMRTVVIGSVVGLLEFWAVGNILYSLAMFLSITALCYVIFSMGGKNHE